MKNGHTWFGLHANGLNRFDGESIVNYSVESGHLPNNKISCSIQDDMGNILFGTRGEDWQFSTVKSSQHWDEANNLVHNEIYTVFQRF